MSGALSLQTLKDALETSSGDGPFEVKTLIPEEYWAMCPKSDQDGAGGNRPSRRNHVTGLTRFRKAWDAGLWRQNASPKNIRSDQGHINLAGSASCFRSVVFTRADPEFVDSIESGVRDLVLFLVESLGCITYSSCEGHRPVDTLSLRERYVGILPRNEGEHVQLLEFLQNAAMAVQATLHDNIVTLEINEDVITTEGPDVPSIEIRFRATGLDWLRYQAALEPIYREFLSHLHNLASNFRT